MAEPVVASDPRLSNEFESLHGALERIRSTFVWKCGGLDAKSMCVTLAPSSLTLGGLLKHLALVEDDMFTRILLGREFPAAWDAADGDVFDWAWRSAAEDSPEQLITLWREAVARSRSAIAQALTLGSLDKIAARELGGEPVTLRQLLVHANEEYARHTGHADLIRESIDGLIGDKPPQ